MTRLFSLFKSKVFHLKRKIFIQIYEIFLSRPFAIPGFFPFGCIITRIGVKYLRMDRCVSHISFYQTGGSYYDLYF